MLDKLTIEGYRSIRKLTDFELRPLNVLIGANGAGKSNFLGFFRLLKDLVAQNLQVGLQTREGGADACLYLGPKVTRRLCAGLQVGGDTGASDPSMTMNFSVRMARTWPPSYTASA